jgi:hypothetical protein
MDRTERLERIKELKEEADAGRQRIAERQAARESDPFSEQVADARFTRDGGDLIYTEPTTAGDDPEVIYKVYDNSEQASTQGAEDWTDVVAKVVGTVTAHERLALRKELTKRDEKIAKLEAQVEMLVALLGKTKSADVVDLPDWRRNAR